MTITNCAITILQEIIMIKNKEIALNRAKTTELPFKMTPEEVQTEVNDLYDDLERRYGPGFADFVMGRYTDIKPKKRGA